MVKKIWRTAYTRFLITPKTYPLEQARGKRFIKLGWMAKGVGLHAGLLLLFRNLAAP